MIVSLLGPSWYGRMGSDRFCVTCKAPLVADDVAIYLKLVSRTDRKFLCLDCLGNKLQCGREPLEKLIAYYRQSGNCALFR